MRQFLEKNYPDLRGNVQGANYPAPDYAANVIQAVGMIQFATVLLLFFPGQICRALGYAEPPEFMLTLQQNQMTVFLSLFLMSSYAQNLANTGAFEISVNGKMIFSKLDEGRLPTIQEVSTLMSQFGVKAVGGRQFGDRNI